MSLADAQHIALASISRVDALVGWNFKHIVKLEEFGAIIGYARIQVSFGIQKNVPIPDRVFLVAGYRRHNLAE